MDEHVYGDLEEKIRQEAKTVDGILGTEKCHIRKAGMHYYVDLHANVDGALALPRGTLWPISLRILCLKIFLNLGCVNSY